MSKRVTVLDFCECAMGTCRVTYPIDGIGRVYMEDGNGDEYSLPLTCGFCGHVCRVIELDLGPDPAALLNDASDECEHHKWHIAEDVSCRDEWEAYDGYVTLLRTAAEALKATGD